MTDIAHADPNLFARDWQFYNNGRHLMWLPRGMQLHGAVGVQVHPFVPGHFVIRVEVAAPTFYTPIIAGPFDDLTLAIAAARLLS